MNSADYSISPAAATYVGGAGLVRRSPETGNPGDKVQQDLRLSFEEIFLEKAHAVIPAAAVSEAYNKTARKDSAGVIAGRKSGNGKNIEHAVNFFA